MGVSTRRLIAYMPLCLDCYLPDCIEFETYKNPVFQEHFQTYCPIEATHRRGIPPARAAAISRQLLDGPEMVDIDGVLLSKRQAFLARMEAT